jgi:hypothetical protein
MPSRRLCNCTFTCSGRSTRPFQSKSDGPEFRARKLHPAGPRRKPVGRSPLSLDARAERSRGDGSLVDQPKPSAQTAVFELAPGTCTDACFAESRFEPRPTSNPILDTQMS